MSPRSSLRLASSLGFAGAAGGLALPFVRVGEENSTGSFAILWQGIDFVLGGHYSARSSVLLWAGDGYSLQPMPQELVDRWATPTAYPVAARPAFIVAAVLLLAGLLAPVLAGIRPPRMLAAAAGLGGAIALGIGEVAVLGGVLLPSPGAHPEAAYGFWVVLAVLVAVGLVNLVMLGRPPVPDSVLDLPGPERTSESH